MANFLHSDVSPPTADSVWLTRPELADRWKMPVAGRDPRPASHLRHFAKCVVKRAMTDTDPGCEPLELVCFELYEGHPGHRAGDPTFARLESRSHTSMQRHKGPSCYARGTRG